MRKLSVYNILQYPHLKKKGKRGYRRIEDGPPYPRKINRSPWRYRVRGIAWFEDWKLTPPRWRRPYDNY